MGRGSKKKRRRPFGAAEAETVVAPSNELPTISVDALRPAPMRYRFEDGDKFAGGFGPTELYLVDYWTLRARSSQLFETNLYARGLIRRLVRNEINTGLHLEVTPEEAILGLEEDALADWSEDTENRFRVWEKDARLCDQAQRLSFGAQQLLARMEALIAGDVLVTLQQDPLTQLPRVQLINGASVQTPSNANLPAGVKIVHGVELDQDGRHIAFWIRQSDGTSKRMAAYGPKSGRRQAWLVYGTDKRLDDVRGKPILSLILQSLREIDRFRDSTQRKAVINSMLAMFISKGDDKPGTKPITGGAVRRGVDVVADATGRDRRFRSAEMIPGLVLEELQQGEEPKAFPTTGTVENFGIFEEAIVQAIAWANEVPPEILTLAFSSNYSASQAAINEFKMYLNAVRTTFGETFCQPIYEEWLVSAVLAQRVVANGLLESWRDPLQYDVFGAWVSADWAGHIKPAVDLSKLVDGYKSMVAEGFITRDRATRELTGTKYSKNIQKLRRENEQLAEALEPIVKQSAPEPPEPPKQDAEDVADGTESGDDGATDDAAGDDAKGRAA